MAQFDISWKVPSRKKAFVSFSCKLYTKNHLQFTFLPPLQGRMSIYLSLGILYWRGFILHRSCFSVCMHILYMHHRHINYEFFYYIIQWKNNMHMCDIYWSNYICFIKCSIVFQSFYKTEMKCQEQLMYTFWKWSFWLYAYNEVLWKYNVLKFCNNKCTASWMWCLKNNITFCLIVQMWCTNIGLYSFLYFKIV